MKEITYRKEGDYLIPNLALKNQENVVLGNIGIQHLIGYCIIEKENGEYFIRIKSIEDYIKSKFVYDATLTEQKDKRARINISAKEVQAENSKRMNVNDFLRGNHIDAGNLFE